jgi:hypothetical protein
VSGLQDLNLILMCVAVGVSVLAVVLALAGRTERRKPASPYTSSVDLGRDVAMLMGEIHALAHLAPASLVGNPGYAVAAPPASADRDQSARTHDLSAQVRALAEELRELRREVSGSSAEHLPEAARPASGPVRQTVTAQLLDTVVNGDLIPALIYLHGHDGPVPAEREIPGAQQAIAKLLLLKLARADERGVYLTDKGAEVVGLLGSVRL